jgi:hypothetical protein
VPPVILGVERPKRKKMGVVERQGLIHRGGEVDLMGRDQLVELVTAHQGERNLQNTKVSLLVRRASACAELPATAGRLGKAERAALVGGKQPAATRKEHAQAAMINVLKTSKATLQKAAGKRRKKEVHDANIMDKGLVVDAADQLLIADGSKPFLNKIAQQIVTGKQPMQSFGT